MLRIPSGAECLEWEACYRYVIQIRTSPVIRGKWVMEQIMGISPPPPPAVVAELTEDKATVNLD